MSMKKIFLVDDDRLVMATMAPGLRDAGYEVFEASSGEQALALVGGIKPDLMILDIRMPGLSGLDVAEQMQGRSIPYLFLTALGDEKIVKSAVTMGAMGYLVKPIDVPQLIPAIETALGRATEMFNMRYREGHLCAALKQGRETSMAIGALMHKNGMSEKEAFEALRAQARSQQRKLADLATEVLGEINISSHDGGSSQDINTK